MNGDLFGDADLPSVSVIDAGLDITYWISLLNEIDANTFLSSLLSETEWQQLEIWMYGRLVKTPRLTAWHGDENAIYKYSGILNKPKPWSPVLLELKSLVESATAQKYNSVLLNLYRNGNDHLSWHRDNETELGSEPNIASLSLGATRTFSLRTNSADAKKEQYDWALTNGSLICMRGKTQLLWQHSIKKEPKVVDPRINLTFRRVSPS